MKPQLLKAPEIRKVRKFLILSELTDYIALAMPPVNLCFACKRCLPAVQ